MEEPFKILVDRLKGGLVEKIEGTFDSSFLAVEEEELKFPEKVSVRGDAYVTDTHLVLRLKASTKAIMPCAICNKMIQSELKIDNFYHTEPLEEIRDAIFDFTESLREALLIELPQYVECNKGKCPERPLLAPYLRAQTKTEKTTHFPFADMDLN